MKTKAKTQAIWWVSWIQPTQDFRPLTDPPMKSILGWWCSGCDSDDNATLCAAVLAESEAQAKRRVRKDWPEAKEWRFIEEREPTWRPNDRFPLNYWMKNRFKELDEDGLKREFESEQGENKNG